MTISLAGLFKARPKEAARTGEFARSMRLCGEYLAAQQQAPTSRQARLTQAIGVLATSLDTPSADAFAPLLQVGERALEAGGDRELDLALELSATLTRIRQRSKGAWRLRGTTLDRLGRGEEALECYERYLALTQDGTPAAEVLRRMDTLRRRRDCLDAAAELFPETGSPLRGLIGQPTSAADPEFAAFVRARVAQQGPGEAKVRRLVELYGTYRRLVERDGTPGSLIDGSAPIGVSQLRGIVAGRTVCLVSGAAEVAESALGTEIDGYDLVVRCDSFRTRAQGTGERTDLHAFSLRGDSPWDGPAWTQRADIRLVFGDPAGPWRRAVRQRLSPGAQRLVGDASLRRPLGDPALLGERGWESGTTTAFTALRLLDFLDVSPRLDLIGFDLPGQLRPKEAEWVRTRAKHVDDSKMRIALR